jgi:hypothetical protein
MLSFRSNHVGERRIGDLAVVSIPRNLDVHGAETTP